MDEFRTFKVCHSCQDMTLITAMIDLHNVLTCKSCGTMWQRDLNASKNIFKISQDIITGCEINNRRAAANASSRLLLFTHTTTSLLCPVAAIEAHNFRIAYSACIAKHLVFSNQQLHRFLRSIQAHSIPIGAKRISHNIKQIMIRVKNPAQAPVPMARGLAATLAAQASVSMDNIIAHGSWYSCDIFKHYYRLSSATFTNFSVSTLDQQPRSRLTKCNDYFSDGLKTNDEIVNRRYIYI